MNHLRKHIKHELMAVYTLGKEQKEYTDVEWDVCIDSIIDATNANMHESIMNGQLWWPATREDAWLFNTTHKWIDRVSTQAKEKTND